MIFMNIPDGRKLISVIGTSTASRKIYDLALEVGRLLARRGWIVACGGRGGVMEAVCRGVSEEGGISIGFLPGDLDEANPYVTIPVPTGIGEARNFLVVNAGRGVISIGGAFGTLSEVGFALRSGKPMVGLATWKAIDDENRKYPEMTASSPEEAVDMVLAAITGGNEIVES
jgi:uncharacterized protein (TIGR00725 family)